MTWLVTCNSNNPNKLSRFTIKTKDTKKETNMKCNKKTCTVPCMLKKKICHVIGRERVGCIYNT